MSRFLVGLDLGQAQDYTAIMIAERLNMPTGEVSKYDGSDRTVAHYHVRHLERFRLGTPYPAIVERVGWTLEQEPLKRDSTLVVDGTGVGKAVVDMLMERRLAPQSITITGGDSVTHEGNGYRVPKRDLVATMQVLLQTERIKVAEELPEASLLVQELLSFQVKITTAGNDTYGVWREGQHDDLVLAIAVALWFGELVGEGFGIWV